MKNVVFLFLLIAMGARGQRPEYATAFLESIPDSLGKPVHLPDPGYSAAFDLDAIASYREKERVFVIGSEDLYKKIFWNYRFTKDSIKFYGADKDEWYHKWMIQHLRDSLPVIDFSREELVVYSACAQCLYGCRHKDGFSGCHRNACDFSYAWFIRKKRMPAVQ